MKSSKTTGSSRSLELISLRNRVSPPPLMVDLSLVFVALRIWALFAIWILWCSNSTTSLLSDTVYWPLMIKRHQMSFNTKTKMWTITCSIKLWTSLLFCNSQIDSTTIPQNCVSVLRVKGSQQTFANKRMLKSSLISGMSAQNLFLRIRLWSTSATMSLAVKQVLSILVRIAAMSDNDRSHSHVWLYRFRIARQFTTVLQNSAPAKLLTNTSVMLVIRGSTSREETLLKAYQTLWFSTCTDLPSISTPWEEWNIMIGWSSRTFCRWRTTSQKMLLQKTRSRKRPPKRRKWKIKNWLNSRNYKKNYLNPPKLT